MYFFIRELEASERDLGEITPPPSVLDVASLLKQFLRELPLPLLPSNMHSLLIDAISKVGRIKSVKISRLRWYFKWPRLKRLESKETLV